MVSIFSFNKSFFFLKVPNTICQRSSCGKFSTKFLISLVLTSNDALLFSNEINKLRESYKISEERPEALFKIHIEVLNMDYTN